MLGILLLLITIVGVILLKPKKDKVAQFRKEYIKRHKNNINTHTNSYSIEQFDTRDDTIIIRDSHNGTSTGDLHPRYEIEDDGTIICGIYNENKTDENILLVPNIYNIIDTHISMRNKHSGKTIYTAFADKHCQLLSNSQTDLMLDMLFETGNLKEQLELEMFKESRYYSFFANDSNCSYTLVLNTDKKIIAQIIVDIMINVYRHPKGKFLDCSTEIL